MECSYLLVEDKQIGQSNFLEETKSNITYFVIYFVTNIVYLAKNIVIVCLEMQVYYAHWFIMHTAS